jgi:hypothetical protein
LDNEASILHVGSSAERPTPAEFRSKTDHNRFFEVIRCMSTYVKSSAFYCPLSISSMMLHEVGRSSKYLTLKLLSERTRFFFCFLQNECRIVTCSIILLLLFIFERQCKTKSKFPLIFNFMLHTLPLYTMMHLSWNCLSVC